MKKKLLCLCLFFLVLSLTGCVKYNASMDIKKDKSMDFSIVYAVDTSIFGDASPIESDSKDELIKQGFSVEEYTEGNMKGVTLTKTFKNIDSVSSTSSANYSLSGIMEENSSTPIFSVKKGFLKNTYTAKFTFDASDSDIGEGLSELDQSDDAILNEDAILDDEDTIIDDTILNSDDNILGGTTAIIDEDTIDVTVDGNDDMPDFSNALMSSMDLKFSVTLPYAALSNNATSVSDGNKSLVWTLNNDSNNAIEFSFELYNLTNILIVAGGALLLLILLIVIIVSVSKKGKKKGDAVVADTVSEVPDLVNTNISSENFSEQKFNEQLMAQNVNEVASDVSSVPVTPSVEPVTPAASVVPNLVPEVNLAANQSVVEPVQPIIEPAISVQPEVAVQESVQPTVQNVFEQPVIQEVSTPNIQPVVEPVAPVQPVVEPVAPVQPVAEPVTPVQPVAEPVTPAQPVAEPVAPVQPVVEPVAPAQPVVEPVAPAQPVDVVDVIDDSSNNASI